MKPRQTTGFTTKDFLTIVAGLIVFVAVSAATIGASSIWFDEAFGAYLIRFGFFDVARYTASDVHPPLYYWALKLWSSWFGYDEVALRSLSVLFGAIALVFAWLLVRRYFGRRAAAGALLFAAVTPFFVRYAQEARMYTMVAAIAFAATYVLTLADRSKRTGQWVVYGLLVGLGMLTHYYALLIWLTHWLWRAATYLSSGLRGRKFLREFFSRGWLIAHAVALLVFAPWIGAFIAQLRDVQANGFWILPITPATPINFLTNVVFYLQQNDVRSWGALVFGLFTVGLIGLVFFLGKRVLKGEQKTYYRLIVLLAVVPPLLLILLSLPPLRPSFVDRYVVPSALAFGLLTGLSIMLLRPLVRRRTWIVVFIAALGVFGYGISNVYRLGNFNNNLSQSNDTRQVVAMIRERTPDTPIVTDSPWLYYEAAFYSTSRSPVMFIDANTDYKYGSLLMLRENDLGKITDLAGFEADHPVFWYVGRTGSTDLTAPDPTLRVVSQFRLDDTITGQPAYQAVEYAAR